LRLGLKLAPGEPLLRYHLARLAGEEERHGSEGDDLARVVRELRHENPAAAAIALTDLTGLEAVEEAEEPRLAELSNDGAPAELRGNLDADLRVVLSTNQPDYRLYASVEEPTGHVCHYESPCGGRIASGKGVTEYMMRRALPGRYTIKCCSSATLTVHATFYRNWGRPTQTRMDRTIQLEGDREEVTLAEYKFEFVE
jgi:hypothetical protein